MYPITLKKKKNKYHSVTHSPGFIFTRTASREIIQASIHLYLRVTCNVFGGHRSIRPQKLFTSLSLSFLCFRNEVLVCWSLFFCLNLKEIITVTLFVLFLFYLSSRNSCLFSLGVPAHLSTPNGLCTRKWTCSSGFSYYYAFFFLHSRLVRMTQDYQYLYSIKYSPLGSINMWKRRVLFRSGRWTRSYSLGHQGRWLSRGQKEFENGI